MKQDQLQRLIAGGETLEVEFKGEEKGRLDDPALVETVVCLANRPGSTTAFLLVGAEAGLAKDRGERKGRAYHLSAATYRRLGAGAAYARQRDFEPIQQEQMILQYVVTHGKITPKEAAELCRISRPQAYRLLQRLEKKDLYPRPRREGRMCNTFKSTRKSSLAVPKTRSCLSKRRA